ncbi:MAG: hypothetical protein V1773_14915 [bacterium]
MKKSILLFVVFALSLSIFGCKDDDNSTENVTPKDPIVGTWVSEGNNVAPLLVYFFKAKKITATFNENFSYTVVQIDSSNGSTTFTGTYTLTKGTTGTIYQIVVNQQTPSVLIAEGIYQIDTAAEPDGMKYEVIQTTPAIGATPPTVTAGFGSSSGGALGTSNIQKYVRVQ